MKTVLLEKIAVLSWGRDKAHGRSRSTSKMVLNNYALQHLRTSSKRKKERKTKERPTQERKKEKKVTDQTRLSKPLKALLKPRPTIGQSLIHATQYTGRLTARPPTRLTSGERRGWCQKLRGTLIPSNKRKDKQSNTNAYGRKGRKRKRLYTNACGKERKNRSQMPMVKKERPNHK